ncbi:MAG: fructose-1,6-bisphosphatase/inositol monophosphatase family enzyme [Saprospiraceae bacterium]|jgi:fructose-1,6-bisphosphatase/inositol monophosphatase family enzyme
MNDNELIKNSLKDTILPCNDSDSPVEWARFGLFIGVRFLQEVRSRRFLIPSLVQNEKADGSPATQFEEGLELFAIEKLKSFYPLAGYIGEESGDLTSKEEEIIMVLDPIDGTRSFLSGFDTYSVTLSILKNKNPIFSLICSPSTSDVGYRIGNEQSKLFQFNSDPSKIKIHSLPLLKDTEFVLVNIHPARDSLIYLEKLYKMWQSGSVALVRSVSGSPSLMFLEVAKGSCIYINAWGKGKTYPFDILPGLHILQGSGGYILDRNGHSIDPWNHEGLFIAGLQKNKMEEIFEKL